MDYTYTNGNYQVTLLSDGTKIRETIDSVFRPEHSESIDMKITNFCDMGHICGYCHEASHLKGAHGNLRIALDALESLPAGVELAIGGGNPLAHPGIVEFLEELKGQGIVANLTVNHLHLEPYADLIRIILNRSLTNGLGISYRRGYNPQSLIDLMEYEHAVLHVIAGVDDPDDVAELVSKCKTKKVLILGYKDFRKGKHWHDTAVDRSLKKWFAKLPIFIGDVTSAGGVVSFDNLGIEQLKPDRILTKEEWSEFFQGEDGSHTFYIDAVRQEYARSSTSPTRWKFDGKNATEMFQHVNSTI